MTRNKYPSKLIMAKYIDQAHQLAWQFHKKSGINMDELKSVAYEGLCEAAAAWRPEKGRPSTMIYRCVVNALVDFGKKEFRHCPIDSDVELPGSFANPSRAVEFKDSVAKLGQEAKEVCAIIFGGPTEILGIAPDCSASEIKRAIVKHLSGRWSERTVRDAFAEIKGIF